MYKYLWKWFGKGLTKYYLSDQNKPTQLAQLTYAFTDSKGRKYYRFPENMALPFDRYGKLMEYLTLINARLTSENLKAICDKALEIIQDGIGKEKNAARVAALLYEIRDRGEWIVPVQLIYNVLALQYVREDEVPDEFSNDMQLQKVDTFMTDICKHSFFFTLPELKKLYGLTIMSEEGWTNYCQKSAGEDMALKKLLNIISSKK